MKKVPVREVRKRALEISGIEPSNKREAGVNLFPYAAEDYAFLNSIVEDEAAFPGFEVAYTSHRIVDAVYRSARNESSRVAIHDPSADMGYPAT